MTALLRYQKCYHQFDYKSFDWKCREGGSEVTDDNVKIIDTLEQDPTNTINNDSKREILFLRVSGTK